MTKRPARKSTRVDPRSKAGMAVAPIKVDFDNDPDDRLVTPVDLCRWLQISHTTLLGLQRTKPPYGLPAPIRLGSLKRWRLGALRRWMQQREQLAARDAR